MSTIELQGSESLLDVSGELSAKRLGRWSSHIGENSVASEEYQEIREQFELLEKLPPVMLVGDSGSRYRLGIVNVLAAAFQASKQIEKQAREHING